MAYKSRYMQIKFGDAQSESAPTQEYKSNYMRSRGTTAAAPVTLESLIKRPTSKQQEMQSRVEKLTQRSHNPQSKYQTWADDSYKMSSDERKSAKQFVSDVDKQLWAARKNGTFDSQMNNPESELAKNYELATKLKNKTSLGAAFTAGFAKGTGGLGATRLAAKATGNEALKNATESIKKTADTTQSANPIVGGAGYFGGKMAEYAVGKGVMTGLPVVGTALGKAGAAANTALSGAGKAGAAASKFFTAERLAGLMGDQMLDVALDTLPEAVENVQSGKKASDVAGAAAKNFAINALFNVGGEVVPAAAGKVIGKLKGSDNAAKSAVDSIPEIKKEKNSIPPTQVNTEVSQSAVSDTAFSNPSISKLSDNATPASKEVSDNILNQLYSQPGDLGAKTSQFKYKEADSKFRTNTIENTDMLDAADRAVMPSEEFKHQVITEKQSLSEAAQRAAIDFDGEVADLMKKNEFDGTDFDTGMKILEKYKQDFSSAEVGSVEREIAGNNMLDWAKTMQQKSTDIGQALQAHAKYTRTPEGTVLKAQSAVANAQKQWSKENPNLAKAMDELTRKLETIADNYANDLPADPMAALSELEKAVKKVVGDSEVKLEQNDIEKLITAMSRDSGKDIGDFLKELDNIPVISGDDVMQIMDIMSEAEKYGVNSRKRVELENQAYKIVADKFNSSAMDKWNAWRYLAMLGNPRTHIRNFVGNTFFGSVTRIKDDVSSLLQKALPADQRTTSILSRLSDPDVVLKKAAKENADEVYALLTKGGKYNPTNIIKDQQTVFKNKTLENLRKFNGDALEKEDWFALSGKYADSLARYLKAKGVDASIFNATDDTSKNLLETAQVYAVNEAQKATFRDASKFADAISKFAKTNKGTEIFVEGVIPFKKTPINIVKRGAEYSPLGLFKTFVDYKGMKRGTKTSAQVMDDLAATLTGSAIMCVGALASYCGILTSGKKDDKKGQSFDELQGKQNYALNIGSKSYTLDWAAPAALPLFVGAEVYHAFTDKENSGNGLNDFFTALSRISTPVLEMTMMQGLNNALQAVAYGSSDPAWDAAVNASTSYFSQGIPTIGGQVTRAFDDTRRITYTDETGLSGGLDRLKQQAQKKMPGFSQKLQPKVDQWGRVQKADGGDSVLGRLAYNMLSPGYYSENKTTKVDSVLNQLYEKTGDASVLPSTARKYYKENNQTKYFTPEQYTKYAITRGETAYSMAEKLAPLMGNMEPSLQSEIIKDAYTIADELGKNDALGKPLSNKNQKIIDAAGGATEYEKIARLLIAYSLIDEIEGDKYPNGKTIPGSTERNKKKALKEAGVEYPDAHYFYNLFK